LFQNTSPRPTQGTRAEDRAALGRWLILLPFPGQESWQSRQVGVGLETFHPGTPRGTSPVRHPGDPCRYLGRLAGELHGLPERLHRAAFPKQSYLDNYLPAYLFNIAASCIRDLGSVCLVTTVARWYPGSKMKASFRRRAQPAPLHLAPIQERIPNSPSTPRVTARTPRTPFSFFPDSEELIDTPTFRPTTIVLEPPTPTVTRRLTTTILATATPATVTAISTLTTGTRYAQHSNASLH